MEIMGVRYCDFAKVPDLAPFGKVAFCPTTTIFVQYENGNFASAAAEILETEDPDNQYYLIKNPEPKFSQANHYLVISNRVSIAAFPKPQLARDWAKNIGNAQ